MIKFNLSMKSWLNLLLYLGFTIIILLMAASLFISINSASSTKNLSHEIHSKQIPQTVTLLKLEQQLTLSLSQLSAFLITGHKADEEKLNNTLEHVNQGFIEYVSPQQQSNAKLVEVVKQVNEYTDKAKQLIIIKKNYNKNFVGVAKATDLLNPLYREFVGIMEELINDELSRADEINIELLSSLIKTRSSWYRMIMSLRVYFITTNNNDFEKFDLYLEQNRKEIKQLSTLKEQFNFNVVFVNQLESVHAQYLANLPKVLAIYQDDKWRQDIYVLKTEIYPLMAEVLSQIRKIVKHSESQTTEHIHSMQSEMNKQVTLSKLIFIISLSLGIIIIVVVARKVSKIAQSLVKSQQKASQHLIKANERTLQLELTSKELQNSIDALENAQKQLIETEKMAALGSLVAGISHEINTPIGISVTSSSFLLGEFKKLKNIYESEQMTVNDLNEFIDTGIESTSIILVNQKQAVKLISSFKQIAVDQSCGEIRTFNLIAYLNKILLSLRPKLKQNNISTNIKCPNDLEINSYPGIFSQIISNFVMNSIIHGFKKSDKGSISVQVEPIKDKNCKDMIKLIYSDDGMGMSEEIRNKVFEPFFTTRRNSGGSGIGMSIVHNLITQKLQGTISLHSEPEKGTQYTIVIPTYTN